MISLIITIVSFLIVLFVIYLIVLKYRNSKKKVRKEQTPTESIIRTFGVKFNKLISDLNNQIRTPQIIKEEIEQLFNAFYKEKSLEFKDSLVELNNSLTNLRQSKDTIITLISKISYQINDMKEKYKESGKEEFAKMGAELVAKKKRAENNLANVTESIKNTELLQVEIETKCNMFATEFHLRKSEVLLKIVQFNTKSPSFANIKIDDLIQEFEVKASEEQVKAKVDNIMSGRVEEGEDRIDINAFKESCR